MKYLSKYDKQVIVPFTVRKCHPVSPPKTSSAYRCNVYKKNSKTLGVCMCRERTLLKLARQD